MRKILALETWALTLVVAAVLFNSAAPGAGADTPDAVSVCLAPTDASAQPLYAADLGFFAKHGLNVTLQTMQTSALAYSAAIGGSCTFGYANTAVAETAFAKGLPVTVVAPASTSDYSHGGRVGYFMVRNGVDITTPKELEGKVVAESDLHSISWLATVVWLDANGADSTKVKFIEIPFTAMPAAFQAGRIDSGMLIEPFASQARPYAKTLGDDPYRSLSKKDIIGGVFFTVKPWAVAHTDIVERFAAALREAGDWANAHHAESAQILSKYTKVPVAQIQAFPRLLYVDRTEPAMIQPTIDAMVKYKVIDKSFNAADLIFTPGK